MPTFTQEELAFIRQVTGIEDVEALYSAIRACGFDEARYLASHKDLTDAGLNPSRAFIHFLAHGVKEGRAAFWPALDEGLPGLLQLRSARPALFDDLIQLFFGANGHRINQTPDFRTPPDLSLTKLPIDRVLVIGSCFSENISRFVGETFEGAKCDHVTYNFAGALPDQPPHPIENYAFQLTMLPLRSVMRETLFTGLSWNDLEAFQQRLSHSEEVLIQMLEGSLGYNKRHGLTAFISNFLCPQSNSMGRLLPYCDPRNPIWYVRRLNDVIAQFCADHHGVYLLNADEIASAIGRAYIQDDFVCLNSHGMYAIDSDWEQDQKRLHAPRRLTEGLSLRTNDFVANLWREIEAMYRTLRQVDSVKVVICDLDDTLWRGVVAEDGIDRITQLEGWPLGLIEALTYLKRRGVLLAICSKNDEARIRSLWPLIMCDQLSLSDFAVVKINWEPKSWNVDAILRETNLLARNAVFIDDNPAERQSVIDAHPGIRVLGGDLYAIRRVLMWAPESQVASISEESARRTDMIQAQVERERTREIMPRHEFLNSLNVRLMRFSIDSIDDTRFQRAFELVNKSNQFNTTGRRWTVGEMTGLFRDGARLEVFEVSDRFTTYGLVGVAVISDDTILQYVMSCRVIGLDVEQAFIATLAADLLDSHLGVKGVLIETDANVLARDLFQKMGFTWDGETWVLRHASITPPPHVLIERAARTDYTQTQSCKSALQSELRLPSS
jgi:FkbH-like protein